MDKTFIMLKPDAIERNLTDTIFSYFRKEGFIVDILNVQTANRENLQIHYKDVFEQYGETFTENMMTYFVGKTVLPMVIIGENVIERVRKITGATNPANAEKGTIRGDLSDDSFEKAANEKRALHNLIHASDSFEHAKAETAIWIPNYSF